VKLNKFSSKLAIGIVLLMVATAAFAQNYPLPGSSSEAPRLCTGCPRTNPSGQSNDGLKTWPYSLPIKAFVGRYVDSVNTSDWQGPFRTARAARIVVAPTQRGSAPPRIYIQIGSALTATSLSNFFTTTLTGGLKTITDGFGISQHPLTNELALKPDAYVYPEAGGWRTPNVDGQDRLFEFDYDDRGYVYVAYSVFGWGIVKDTGTGLELQQQILENIPSNMTAKGMVSVKAGSEYYALLYNPESPGVVAIYNVTNPTATLATPGLTNRRNQAIASAAKSPAGDRLAFVDVDHRIQIYDTSSYVNGSGPIASFTPNPGKQFLGVASDADGNFWAIEDNPPGGSLVLNSLWKFTLGGGTYTQSTFDVYGEAYAPSGIRVRDGYIAIYGQEAAPGTKVYDPRLYKITNGSPVLIDLKDYFRNYYHYSPKDYAMPEGYTQLVRDFMPIKYGSKTYVMYSDHGLGDVYELQAGDSLSATYTTGGTLNPNSKATVVGPYWGDPITFNSAAPTSQFPLNVAWDFGNPEGGSANAATARTGDAVTYQYRGVGTAAGITAPKTAKVSLTNDSSTSDTATITHKAPVVRPLIYPSTGASYLLTDGALVLPEDKFADGSDGSIESHVVTYTISNTDGSGAVSTKKPPHGLLEVGTLGAHRLVFSATYGAYNNATYDPLVNPGYVVQAAAANYNVRPFIVSPIASVANGNTVTYSATARKTSDTTLILPSATTWNVVWRLKNGSTVVDSRDTNPAIGNIPNFVINDKSTITNGMTVELSVTIASAGLGTAAQPFGTVSASQVQATPDASLAIASGCTNTGGACTINAVSNPNYTYAWSINGVAQPGSTSTLSPSFNAPGTYTVAVTVTSGIFTVTTTPALTLNIQGPVCGPLPTGNTMYIGVYGLTSTCRGTGNPTCQTGETIQFSAAVWGYTIQACDSFTWSFGDGGQGSGPLTTHTYPGNGPYNVTLTITNANGSKDYSATVTLGSVVVTPTCPAPNGATITVSGSLGCNGVNIACKTGEFVTFSAHRAQGAALDSCDSVFWQFSDFQSSGQSSYTRTFNSAGPVTVNMSISNGSGSASAPPLVLNIQDNANPGCSPVGTIDFTYQGQQTGCSSTSLAQCNRNEPIQFTATGFGYTFQSCDSFLWTFGDGNSSTDRNPTHAYTGGSSGYEVTLKVTNTNNSKTASRSIRLAVPLKPIPTVSVASSTDKAGKGTTITFTGTASLSATGWTWNFGDSQTDVSQVGAVSTTSTVQHTFATAGPYVVTCSARNADDISSAPAGSGTKQIEITNTPEHRFLLPVVTRIGGIGGSVWRTDVQVFNPDPTVSPSNPMILKVTFKGTTKDVTVSSSTFISEDFMKYFLDAGQIDSGPMTVSVTSDYQPQIWTRTYNLATIGTYGQFIPAVLLSGNSSSATALPTVETFQYLPGLRSGANYRTNIGLVNPMSQDLKLTVSVYSNTYQPIGSTQQTVHSFELVQFSVDAVINGVPKDKPYLVKITVPANSWLISYASMVDQVSGDPTYIGAVSDVDVASADLKDLVVPGVGHTGPWRSDVTIFNPDFEPAVVDLAYFNQDGVLSGEAKQITIQGRNFVQLDDLLRAGYLAPQPGDGIGALLIKSTWPVSRYPIAYSRTFNFNGVSSFGQGIPAFSAARANVRPGKPAYIPAVRNDADKSYYTNIGLVNLTADAVKVKVTLLRFDTGAESNAITYDLKPFQSTVGNILDALGGATRGSLKVTIEGSSGSVWAFASVIDRRTGDPEYLAGVPTP